MRFRRKKEDAESVADAGPEAGASSEASPPDPAAWALPADAAVAAGGDVARPGDGMRWENGDPQARASTPPPSEPISGAAVASPGAGLEDGPRAAAAAAAGAYAQPPKAEPQASGAATAGATADRPELLVAGAFVGAFLFAKIIKRIGD